MPFLSGAEKDDDGDEDDEDKEKKEEEKNGGRTRRIIPLLFPKPSQNLDVPLKLLCPVWVVSLACSACLVCSV